MPAAKKKKTAKSVSTNKSSEVKALSKQVNKLSEQTQMLLFVFAISMMAFAFVLYMVYAK